MNWDRLACRVGDVALPTPVVIASGVWPLDTDEWCGQALEGVGAICTKGITAAPREGNSGHRIWETPCGMLNSIGLQNPGMERFCADALPSMLAGGVPLVANIAPASAEEIPWMLERLRPFGERLATVELNLSCPNVDRGGLSWGGSLEGIHEATSLARAGWPGALWVKISPQAASIGNAVEAAARAGGDAVVVANTWLGMAMDVEQERPAFRRTFAGLSGPAVFPLALRAVWEAAACDLLPVVACGGVADWRDLAAMLLAGASAVEVGTALCSDLTAPRRLCEGLDDHMEARGYRDLTRLVGKARCGQ
ncbi:MAG: nitronate monooxygenase [Synergistales bacterium]|nr:nitronate monooxygenase [Synergistales bacterium]